MSAMTDAARPGVRGSLLPVVCLGFGVIVWCVASDVLSPPSGLGTLLLREPATVYAAVAVTHVVLGSLVLAHGKPRRFGAWVTGCGLLWSVTATLRAWARLTIADLDPTAVDRAVLWAIDALTYQAVITTSLLMLVFPTGRFLPGVWGVAGRVAVVVMVSAGALIATGRAQLQMAPQLDPARDPRVVEYDPTVVARLVPVVDDLLPGLIAVSFLAFCVPVLTAVARYRRAAGIDRDPLRWLLWSVVVEVLLTVVGVVLGAGQLGTTTTYVAVLLPLLGMLLAVLDPRVVAIEDLLTRTVVYGGLSLLIVGVDLAALAGLTAVLGDALDEQTVVLVVLVVSASLYGPLRSWAWAVARRLVLGDRDDPYDVVAGLAASLESAEDGPAQLETVAGAVASAFGVGFVSVEVDRGRGERLVVTRGERPAATRTLPIAYRGTQVGHVVLPASGIRSRLSSRDEQLLGDLVRQAATAARTSRLAEDLQDSREHLVVAREEERRRIRRDLHDGLGPSLSGVVFQLESAKLNLDRAPEVAAEQLSTTIGYVQDVVADVRRLVHDLRPPALDDRGLLGAVRQQADRLGAGLDVIVQADDLGRLPAAVEVAAFRIVGEALTNVAKHAHATRVRVLLTRGDDDLALEVADDGRGIPADVQTGVGLVSLRERAAELGGHTEVTCPESGGTVVRARLPIRTNTHEPSRP